MKPRKQSKPESAVAINLRLPDRLWKQLKIAAAADDRSLNSMIVVLLKTYLENGKETK